MDKYIIYAGGQKGYRLYDAHPQFPVEYRGLVEDMYTQQPLVDNSDLHHHRRCYRFAPLGDGYVLSILYKGCHGRGEGRTIFATVNWVFSAQEADRLFQADFRKAFCVYVQQSDRILQDNGYEIPEPEPIPLHEDYVLCGDVKQALTAAAYSGAMACKEKRIRMQVMVGRDTQPGLFDDVFALLDSMPVYLRKTVSFHIGFSAVSELSGVVLGVTTEDMLQYIVSTGRYGGAMATVNQRITVLDDRLTEISVLPPAVEEYTRLNAEQRERVDTLFSQSENAAGYWDYVHTLASTGTELPGSALIAALGERAFLGSLSAGLFTDDQLIRMYEQRDAVAGMTAVAQALEKFAKPLYVQRLAEQEVLSRAAHACEEDCLKRSEPAHSKKSPKKGDKNSKTNPKSPREEHGKKRDDPNKSKHPREDDEERKSQKNKRKSTKHPSASIDMQKELAVVRWVLAPVLSVLLFLMIFALFCCGMFALGALVIAHLPTPWHYIAYGVQLVVTALISMVGGYLVLSYFGKRFARRTDKTEDSL